jgi:hypothetical protein
VTGALRTPETITAAYFLFLLAVVWMRGPRERRAAVTLRALSALALIAAVAAAASWAGHWSIAGVRDWIPGVYILLGYWLSGQFFVAPQPQHERQLARLDVWLFERAGLNTLVRRAPRLVLECLELTYLCVYPLLPAAFLWLLVAGHANAADRFWTAVVIAELGCYACMPWIQTRPPRVLEAQRAIDERPVAVRRLNEIVLREGSVQANTVPSGHAAGALAIACIALQLDPIAGPVFLALAMSITVATVVGRYHFAIDAIGGVIAAVSGCAVARWLG